MTVVLIVITMFPTFSRGGVFYVAAMLLAGVFLLFHSSQLAKASSRVMASGVLRASVIFIEGGPAL